MTVQSSHDSLDIILQRIDTMMDELQALRQAVQSLVSRELAVRKLVPESNGVHRPRRSVVDILADAPGQRLFQSAATIETYLAEERDSWDS